MDTLRGDWERYFPYHLNGDIVPGVSAISWLVFTGVWHGLHGLVRLSSERPSDAATHRKKSGAAGEDYLFGSHSPCEFMKLDFARTPVRQVVCLGPMHCW